jgi:tetratricopeptide (TPR) repeat protein
MNKMKLRWYWVLTVVAMLFATNGLPVFGEPADLQLQRDMILSKIDAGDIAASKSAVDDMLASFSGYPEIARVIDEVAGRYRKNYRYAEAIEMYRYIVTNYGTSEQAIGAQARMVKAYISINDNQAAETAADELPVKFAGNSELGNRICEIADCFHRFGGFEKAKQLYQRAAGLGLDANGSYGIWAQKGLAMAAIRLGDDSGAEAAIAKLKIDFVGNDRLARSIGEIAREYCHMRKFDKAGELYKYAVASWPGDKEAMLAQVRLVKTYNEQGDVTAVGAEFNKLFSDFRTHKKIDEAACELGDYFSDHEQRAKALLAYKYVVDNCPDSQHMRQALSGVAKANIYLGDEAAAQAAIEKLKAGFANNEKIVRDMCQTGACYQLVGQIEKAQQLYGYVLSLSGLPGVEIVTVWKQTALALSQMCQKDNAASQATLERLCVDFPHSPNVAQALHEVAEICAQQQDYQRAGAIWQETLETYPEKTVSREKVLYLIGICHHKLKNYQKAIECYTEIAESYPDDYFTRRASYHLGMLNRKLGNYNEAVKWLEKHYRLCPDEPTAENALFCCGTVSLFEVKDYPLAIEVFQEYLSYDKASEGRIPQALYALALSYEKTGATGQMEAMLSRLQKEYPESIFAQGIEDKYSSLLEGGR